MPEINMPPIRDFPVYDSLNGDQMRLGIENVYTVNHRRAPGYIIRAAGVYDLRGELRARTIGNRVAGTFVSAYGRYDAVQYSNQGITPAIATAHHLDGLNAGMPFMQIHANGESGPFAAVEMEVRELDPDTQHVLLDYALAMPNSESVMKQAFLSDMPDVVSKYAPVVAQWRGLLGYKDAIVMRNGFDARNVSDKKKYLTTHSFKSVDVEGNPVDEARTPTVDFVYLPVRAPKAAVSSAKQDDPPKTGFFARRRKNVA